MHSQPGTLHTLLEAIDNLRMLGHRALLALLGIVVGSASVVALLNIGASAATQASRSFQTMGSDMLVVSFGQGARPMPTTLDHPALHDAVPGLARIASTSQASTSLKQSGTNIEASLVGTHGELPQALALNIHTGRFLSRFDDQEAFAVIGAELARQWAELGKPLQVGDNLQIEGYLFELIGIAAPFSASALLPLNVDDSILIPAQSLRRLRPLPEVNNLIIKTTADADVHTTADRLHAYLSAQFPGRQIEVQVEQHLLDGLKRQANAFSLLLVGLGGIALLLAGVGVMNVMLMSVNQRRREIGLRMALGARRRDIRNAFLSEAACLSTVGAVLGALLGIAAAWAFTHLAGWSLSLAPEAIPLGIGCSLLTGVLSGLYPALNASRLQPVEALRDA